MSPEEKSELEAAIADVALHDVHLARVLALMANHLVNLDHLLDLHSQPSAPAPVEEAPMEESLPPVSVEEPVVEPQAPPESEGV
jgi:hypothetical protein